MNHELCCADAGGAGVPWSQAAVAGTVAGAIAGKYAMNKLKKAKPSTQSKIGTGIGALAGYWASGRKRQK